MGFCVVVPDGVWLTGAGEVCCAQPAAARRRRMGREVAGSRIRKFRDPPRNLNRGYTIPVLRCIVEVEEARMSPNDVDPRYPVGRFTPPATITPGERTEAITTLADLPEQLRNAVDGLSFAQLSTPYREGG